MSEKNRYGRFSFQYATGRTDQLTGPARPMAPRATAAFSPRPSHTGPALAGVARVELYHNPMSIGHSIASYHRLAESRARAVAMSWSRARSETRSYDRTCVSAGDAIAIVIDSIATHRRATHDALSFVA